MAIKKSELYSSLWASCDELRGGMDASQYKDYVLVMLFVKYVSDKYAGKPFGTITVPPGASFDDMVALKGKPDIGDQINKKIIGPLAEANKLTDMPDFNDVNKLGSGKEMVDRLSNLIAIFQKPELDFSKNRADGDDILGDAYEFLMRHFATESGKSKGQFYTPAEVSRVMAMIIGIDQAETTAETTVYDPACGSGSLLLKVSGVAKTGVSLYGQEKDSATSGLARMNMILHNNDTAVVVQGNTLSNPKFRNKAGDNLKTFDFVVANPPFSDKRWSNGLTLPDDEPYNRFNDFGVPPSKNGDYAFLLHIVRSLKRNGKGAVILPHGVLFRGNAEAQIRENLIKKGYIKAIIGLPANLFYGTGIPACIILMDKENAVNRKGIFIVDAGKGYIKDGNKNRLREQDLHKIADIVNSGKEIAGYSRMVNITEIEKNEYNLNIPRYIENQEKEDIQDIDAHLNGGIPERDIDELQAYWEVFPSLRKDLFEPLRPGYVQLTVDHKEVRDFIFEHKEFKAFIAEMDGLYETWRRDKSQMLKELTIEHRPKKLIAQLSDSLLHLYEGQPLVDHYAMYQVLMDYWQETMQDDSYLIAADGWEAKTYRILVENSKKKMVDKGWTCDLLPKELVLSKYLAEKEQGLKDLEAKLENVATSIAELEEEHSGDEGYFAEMDKVNKANITARLRELKVEAKSQKAVESKASIAAEPTVTYGGPAVSEEEVLHSYLDLLKQQTELKRKIKAATAELDDKLYNTYPTLTEEQIKDLVVEDKWLTAIAQNLKSQIDQVSQQLANRIQDLGDRYDESLPQINDKVSKLESKVNDRLRKMGFVW